MPPVLLAPWAAAQPWSPVAVPWAACDAVEAATRLRGRPGLAWIDSALTDARLGRWSIVASDPRWHLSARGADVSLLADGGTHRLPAGALAALAGAVGAEPAPHLDLSSDLARLPFLGGAIGTVGFEVGREVERLPATTRDDIGAPDMAFGWYEAALVWDGLEQRGWLVGHAEAVAALQARLEASQGTRPGPFEAGALRAATSRDAYLAAVARARAYIEAGDIYQVNYAQRFSVDVRGDGFDLYRQLRQVSPAPFAAYLDCRGEGGGVEVLSSSPERLLLADGDALETRPIKGTRPRGATPEADACRAAELRASAKDMAEHLMIVDLERNDLGRVAAPGTVHVPEFAALESYRQVHHLTSTVTATRRAEVGLEALLRATFPGGSITGAPKVRSMEIIDELEPVTRGVYTGAIGYISAHGRIDLNVAIRTITLAAGVAHFHVGGAIVHDSQPEAEYTETLDKARGMARALGVRLPDETQ